MSSGGRNESNSNQLAGNRRERKFFINSTCIMSRLQELNVLWAQEVEISSGGRNESNSHQVARIGERKIIHELDVHHVQTVGIERFPAQQAEMSLTAMSSLESARRKFFMNSTYIMSKKVGIKRFWAQEGEISSGGRNESTSHQLARIGERKIVHELDVHHVQKVGIKRFWAEEAEVSLTAISSLESATKIIFMNSAYIMSRKQE